MQQLLLLPTTPAPHQSTKLTFPTPLFRYTKCLYKLVALGFHLAVLRRCTRSDTDAAEAFWREHVPASFKRHAKKINWHAWFLWFSFDCVFDILFSIELNDARHRRAFSDKDMDHGAAMAFVYISIAVSVVVLLRRWFHLRPLMKSLHWALPLEVRGGVRCRGAAVPRGAACEAANLPPHSPPAVRRGPGVRQRQRRAPHSPP